MTPATSRSTTARTAKTPQTATGVASAASPKAASGVSRSRTSRSRAAEPQAAEPATPGAERPRGSRARRAWTLAGILAVLIVIGTALILWQAKAPEDLPARYNGIPLVRAACPGGGDCWYAIVVLGGSQFEIPFFSHPVELEGILFERGAIDLLRRTRAEPQPTVVIGVPDGAPSSVAIAGVQVSRILGDRYGILNMTVLARTVGTGAGQVSCADATASRHILLFQQGPVDAVRVIGPNCVALQATDANRSIAVADAYVYRILGVIPTVVSTPSTPTRDAPVPGQVPDSVEP
jgi:hypothetical protein